MTDYYELETGYPIPDKTGKGSGTQSKWAFLDRMQPDQSFLVPNIKERNRVITAANYRKINLVTRKVEGTKCYRCWLKPKVSSSVTEPEDEWEVRRAQNDGQIL